MRTLAPPAAPAAEYCAEHGSDCPFCGKALDRSESPFDRRLAVGSDTTLIPALGMILPGYFLAVSNDHRLSMAELGADGLTRLRVWLDAVLDRLSPTFGEYVVFEHGTGEDEVTGACVPHAHLHLMPAATLVPYVGTGPEWADLARFSDLEAEAGSGYAYCRVGQRETLYRRPRLGSQWIRRVVADAIGDEMWDWALRPGDDALLDTLRRLPSGLPGAAQELGPVRLLVS